MRPTTCRYQRKQQREQTFWSRLSATHSWREQFMNISCGMCDQTVILRNNLMQCLFICRLNHNEIFRGSQYHFKKPKDKITRRKLKTLASHVRSSYGCSQGGFDASTWVLPCRWLIPRRFPAELSFRNPWALSQQSMKSNIPSNTHHVIRTCIII